MPNFAAQLKIMPNMDATLFNALLPLKVEGVAEELRRQHPHFSLQEALHRIYASATYALLEQESTKLWHYSPAMLNEMISIEQETGDVHLPDLV
jgi:hypothetical protein